MIIAANWKMNFTKLEAEIFLEEFLTFYQTNKIVSEIIIFSPALFLENVYKKVKNLQNIKIGAQNVHYESSGAYTGQLSAPMLKSVGCDYALVGHSECRAMDNNSNSKRVNQVLQNDMAVIICCGESLETKKCGETLEFLKNQLNEALAETSSNDLSKIVIAYEPIWAIGSGLVPQNEEISEIIAHLRTFLSEKFENPESFFRILYGGSCNEKNIENLLTIRNLDGFLIGGASLKIDSFKKIVISSSKS